MTDQRKNYQWNKYRKKPIVIEAIRIGPGMGLIPKVHHTQVGVVIETLEGRMAGGNGDWIIRGVEGELYPCKASVFEATHEEVM